MSLIPLVLFVVIHRIYGNNEYTTQDILGLLNKPDDLPSFNDMQSTYIPIFELDEELWKYPVLNDEELYYGYHYYPQKNAFNYTISRNKDDIELILSQNDFELASMLWNYTDFGIKYFNNIDIPDSFYEFLNKFDDDSINSNPNVRSSSSDNRRRLKKKHKHNKHKKKHKNNNSNDTNDEIALFNFNGLPSDRDIIKWGSPTTGMKGLWWQMSDYCVQHKGCNVYSHARVLHKSKSINKDGYIEFSCNDILTKLLPSVYECINKNGVEMCDMVIDHGYYRVVLKVRYQDKDYVIKMMKPKSINEEKSRDILRNIRESIFLYYIKNEEMEYIKKYGHTFISNNNEKRAFNYVRELGHCVYPVYMSVSPFYNMTLGRFIEKGHSLDQSLLKLMKMALDIAKSVEIMHNIRGGPFTHTDITPKQFMIDNNGHVLINDFNRGKYMMYYFSNEYKNDKYMKQHNIPTNIVVQCRYCPHRSRGNYRAPEEHGKQALNEKIDVFSAALVIWAMFSGEHPYPNIKYNDLPYLYHDTFRRPSMPSNMPFILKDLIRECITQDPNKRPTATQFREKIEDILKHIDRYTKNQKDITAKNAAIQQLFRDTNKPQIPQQFLNHEEST